MERYQVIVVATVIVLVCLVWLGIGSAAFSAPAAMT